MPGNGAREPKMGWLESARAQAWTVDAGGVPTAITKLSCKCLVQTKKNQTNLHSAGFYENC